MCCNYGVRSCRHLRPAMADQLYAPPTTRSVSPAGKSCASSEVLGSTAPPAVCTIIWAEARLPTSVDKNLDGCSRLKTLPVFSHISFFWSLYSRRTLYTVIFFSTFILFSYYIIPSPRIRPSLSSRHTRLTTRRITPNLAVCCAEVNHHRRNHHIITESTVALRPTQP